VSKNAAPRPGDVYLRFNGIDSYVEVPDADDYSVATGHGALSVSAWMRPDVLDFPRYEGTHYVHWMGKGDGDGPTGRQEWAFRMYNLHHTTEHPPRPNRISFYVFNPEGGLGVGSHVQDTVKAGEWLHVVGVADGSRTHLYRNGLLAGCDTYRGPAQGGCPIHFADPPHDTVQLVINPRAGSAPLRMGTRDFASFFEGGLTRVRLWKRALTAHEVAGLYAADAVPRTGLVGEFLLNADTGAVAVDSARGNDGTITAATWVRQH
jgi:hypothetical protein